MGNSTGNVDKKSVTTSKNDKTKEKYWNMLGKKATQVKQTIRLEKINQKVRSKEARLKRYQDRIKQYRQNRTFQNKEKKFYQQVRGECTNTYQQPDDKETKQFRSKIWERREHNRKAEWKSSMELEEGNEGGNTP